jgi:hypothetical protein
MFRSERIQIILKFVAFLVFAIVTVGPAKAFSGTAVLPSCELLLRELQVTNEGGLSFPPQGESCYYYIAAVQDLSRYSENNRLTLNACLPEESKLTQLIRIFVNYAQSHPERLHLPASILALEALRKAFPFP